MGRCIRWPCDDPRHDGRVGHTQACQAVHAQLRVDNSELIDAHLASAHRMSKARRRQSGEFPDLLGRRLRTGNEFGLAHTVKGTLIPEFTRGFDGAHDGRNIAIRAEIVAVDHGGILGVVAGQTDGASARRLHQTPAQS